MIDLIIRSVKIINRYYEKDANEQCLISVETNSGTYVYYKILPFHRAIKVRENIIKIGTLTANELNNVHNFIKGAKHEVY